MKILERAGLETVQAQPQSGLDGQGKPAYGTAVAVQARVVREASVAFKPDGTELLTVVTLWIDAAQPVLPAEESRLTLSDGFVGIAVERMEGKGIGGVVDHVRLKLRRE